MTWRCVLEKIGPKGRNEANHVRNLHLIWTHGLSSGIAVIIILASNSLNPQNYNKITLPQSPPSHLLPTLHMPRWIKQYRRTLVISTLHRRPGCNRNLHDCRISLQEEFVANDLEIMIQKPCSPLMLHHNPHRVRRCDWKLYWRKNSTATSWKHRKKTAAVLAIDLKNQSL